MRGNPTTPPARTVIKTRVPKGYRHPELDRRLRAERTATEARLTSLARRAGVPTPVVRDVDLELARLELSFVGETDLRDALTPERAATAGRYLATLHEAGIVHGDPTTRNIRVSSVGTPPGSPRGDRDGEGDRGPDRAGEDEDVDAVAGADGECDTRETGGRERVYLIDFGLGYHSGHVEDRAMDLHVFLQSVGGTTVDPGPIDAAVLRGYREGALTDDEATNAVDPTEVLGRLDDIGARGRYR